MIGVDIDGAIGIGNGGDGIFAKIETSLRNRVSGGPVSDVEFTILAVIGFIAGGDKAKVLGPVNGDVVKRKVSGVSKMGVPAFPGADEENAVTGIADDVAPIAKIEGESLAGRRGFREEDAKNIVATSAELLFRETFILEEGEGLAGVERNAFDLKSAGESDEEELFTAGNSAKINAGAAFERVVWMDGGINVVAKSVKGRSERLGARQGVGGPNVVIGKIANATRLTQHEIFDARVIDEDIERAGNGAVESAMKEMRRRRIVPFKEDAKGVVWIETFEGNLPGGEQGGIGRGSNFGALELGKQVLGSVVGEAEIAGVELLIENRSAKETGELLFFDGIARKREGVTDAGKNKAGDAALKRLEKSEFSLGEVQGDVGLVDFDAVLGGDGVDGLRIETKRIQGGDNIAGRVRGGYPEGKKEKEQYEEGAKPHNGV